MNSLHLVINIKWNTMWNLEFHTLCHKVSNRKGDFPFHLFSSLPVFQDKTPIHTTQIICEFKFYKDSSFLFVCFLETYNGNPPVFLFGNLWTEEPGGYIPWGCKVTEQQRHIYKREVQSLFGFCHLQITRSFVLSWAIVYRFGRDLPLDWFLEMLRLSGSWVRYGWWVCVNVCFIWTFKSKKTWYLLCNFI